VVTKDASLKGWGAVCEGRIAKGKWPISLQSTHINFLELLTVFLALQFLRNHHILIRSDNKTAVAYINQKGGTRSHLLHSLAQKIIVWGVKHFHLLQVSCKPRFLTDDEDLTEQPSSVRQYSRLLSEEVFWPKIKICFFRVK